MYTTDHKCGCSCGTAGTYPHEQTHVHELLGSVQIGGNRCDLHNHRFATVSDEVEYIPGTCGHVHKIKFRTDFYEDHFHVFSGCTEGPVEVGDGRHVHFIDSVTEVSDQHQHEFRAATLINDPIGEDD